MRNTAAMFLLGQQGALGAVGARAQHGIDTVVPPHRKAPARSRWPQRPVVGPCRDAPLPHAETRGGGCGERIFRIVGPAKRNHFPRGPVTRRILLLGGAEELGLLVDVDDGKVSDDLHAAVVGVGGERAEVVDTAALQGHGVKVERPAAVPLLLVAVVWGVEAEDPEPRRVESSRSPRISSKR